ncbi:hypothetical protein BDF19DRAFT_431440, partial [Syncephalis fuscata]
MISTECVYSNVCIKDVKPIWTLNSHFCGTVPLFGSNRILVMYSKSWAVHSLIDGARLAHIDEETLRSALEAPRLLNINEYAKLLSLYIGRFIIYSSKSDGKFIAVDLVDLNRSKNLDTTISEYLYKKVFERRGTVVKLGQVIRAALLLNDTFNTRNAMLIVDNDEYRIIDMSF